MYYPDLSPYTYSEYVLEEPAVELNVGWLVKEYAFPTGVVSEAFLDALFECCLNSVNGMRGYHVCESCVDPPGELVSITKNGEQRLFKIHRMMEAERNGRQVFIGGAEIRVQGLNNIVYAAPNLVYHYCSVHSYLPPLEFVHAVLHPYPKEWRLIERYT